MGSSRINLPKSAINLKRMIENDLSVEDIETVPKRANCDSMQFTYDVGQRIERHATRCWISTTRGLGGGAGQDSVQLDDMALIGNVFLPRTFGFWRLLALSITIGTDALTRAAEVGLVTECRLSLTAPGAFGAPYIEVFRCHWTPVAAPGESWNARASFPVSQFGPTAAGLRNDTFPVAQQSIGFPLDCPYDARLMLETFHWSAESTLANFGAVFNVGINYVFQNHADR